MHSGFVLDLTACLAGKYKYALSLTRLRRAQMQEKKSLLVVVADHGNSIVHLLLEKNSS